LELLSCFERGFIRLEKFTHPCFSINQPNKKVDDETICIGPPDGYRDLRLFPDARHTSFCRVYIPIIIKGDLAMKNLAAILASTWMICLGVAPITQAQTSDHVDYLQMNIGTRTAVNGLNGKGKNGLTPVSPNDWFYPGIPGKLVAFWPMNIGTGTAVNDLSGQGHNGQITGSPSEWSWVPGIRGNALSFHGGETSPYVHIPAHPDFDFSSGSFTLEAWAKLDGFINTSGYGEVVMGSNWASSCGIVIGFSNDPNPSYHHRPIFIVSTGSENRVIGSTEASVGTWYHLVGVRDASNVNKKLRIYVNGVLAGENDDLSDSVHPTDWSISGQSQTTWSGYVHGCFHGTIDEVAIYNFVLQPEMILLHYNNPKPLLGIITGRITVIGGFYEFNGFQVKLYDNGWNLVQTVNLGSYLQDRPYIDYCFSFLPAGTYYVWAHSWGSLWNPWGPPPPSNNPWRDAYYPGVVRSADATPISVGTETVSGINMILPYTSYVLMRTNPAGFPLLADGNVFSSPKIFEWTEYDVHVIGVEEFFEKGDGGRCYFRDWLHGGPRIQHYTVPRATMFGEIVDTLTARFDYKYRLDILSSHGHPTGAGWNLAWRNTLISVEDTLVEYVPDGLPLAKAFVQADTDSVRYVFDHWEGTGSGSYTGKNNPATVFMNFNITEEAFWKTQYPLIVKISDPSMGSVTVNPPGVWQNKDTTVALKAVPKSGFRFAGWDSAFVGTQDSISIVMNTSKVLLARFESLGHPPVVSIPDTSIAEDDTLLLPYASFAGWITDPVDPITQLNIQVNGSPDHFHFKFDISGLSLWADPDWNGEGWCVVTASDPVGSSASDTIHCTVTPVDDPPGPFDLVSPPNGFVYSDSSKTLTFVWRASGNVDEMNGDKISYVFYFAGNGQTPDSVATQDTTYAWLHPGLEDGGYSWKVKALDNQGNPRWSNQEDGMTVTGIVSRSEVSRSYGLSQNYPNPFNPQTEIVYSVPRKGNVKIEIYSLSGKRIRTLVDRTAAPGEYTALWDGADDSGMRVVSGAYLCKMIADGFSKTIKMTVLK
jgi:hypothetical protein